VIPILRLLEAGMKSWCAVIYLLALGVCASDAAAQSATVGAPPTLITVSGELRDASGTPRTGAVVLVLSLYENRDDPSPRWVEQHPVTLDDAGRYDVQFGSTQAEGIPAELFSGPSVVRWVGVSVDGEPEQPRMMLVSVPYAAKATTAETLAGRAASDFVLSADLNDQVKAALQAEEERRRESADFTANAVTLNYLQKGDGAGGTTDSNIFEVTGKVGVGTASPVGRFHVCCIDVLAQFETTNAGSNAIVRVIAPNTGQSRFDFGDSDSPTIGRVSYNHPTDAFTFFTNNTAQMTIDGSGRVGIGTTTPTAKLHIAGNATVTGNLTVDGNIAAKYQDVAEWVDTREPLEAGTVVVIDSTTKNRVMASARSYDSKVVGAVSAEPGVVLGEPGEGRTLVAQSGRVRVKADARYGAIRPGDLLVTSPTKGHAMRSRPIDIAGQSMHRPGTLIGKALEALPSGRGEVLVLLTLQ
jgi:hypothetical protein